MREIYKEYKKTIKELLNNKTYVFSIILIALLSYGFTISNFSVGIDDLCFDRYVTGTYILSAGRWGTTALYTILQIFSFTPFWLELVVTLLTVIMGIVFTAFLKKQFLGNMKNIHCIITTGMLISYPILHQSFIYQSTNLSVIISNLALMIIPILIYENYKNIKNLKNYAFSIAIIPFFISMYESCCQTFILMTCVIAFIEIFNNEKNREITKNVIIYLFISVLILICSIILNFLITMIIEVILNSNELLMPDYSSKGIPWLKFSNKNISLLLENNILNKLHNDFVELSFVRDFMIIAILTLIITIIKSIKEKKYILIPLMIAIIFSNFIINLLQIKILYRVDTSWCIAITFFTAILITSIKDKKFNNIISLLFCIIILFQTKQMNQYFYNDYIRYKKEAHYAYNIANEIIEECEDTTKPLVYLYKIHDGLHQNQINQDNGWSLINWGSWAFNEPGTEITKFINSLGYNFKRSNISQTKEVEEKLENSEIKINGDKNIYETDEYIIVLIHIKI